MRRSNRVIAVLIALAAGGLEIPDVGHMVLGEPTCAAAGYGPHRDPGCTTTAPPCAVQSLPPPCPPSCPPCPSTQPALVYQHPKGAWNLGGGAITIPLPSIQLPCLFRTPAVRQSLVPFVEQPEVVIAQVPVSEVPVTPVAAPPVLPQQVLPVQPAVPQAGVPQAPGTVLLLQQSAAEAQVDEATLLAILRLLAEAKARETGQGAEGESARGAAARPGARGTGAAELRALSEELRNLGQQVRQLEDLMDASDTGQLPHPAPLPPSESGLRLLDRSDQAASLPASQWPVSPAVRASFEQSRQAAGHNNGSRPGEDAQRAVHWQVVPLPPIWH